MTRPTTAALVTGGLLGLGCLSGPVPVRQVETDLVIDQAAVVLPPRPPIDGPMVQGSAIDLGWSGHWLDDVAAYDDHPGTWDHEQLGRTRLSFGKGRWEYGFGGEIGFPGTAERSHSDLRMPASAGPVLVRGGPHLRVGSDQEAPLSLVLAAEVDVTAIPYDYVVTRTVTVREYTPNEEDMGWWGDDYDVDERTTVTGPTALQGTRPYGVVRIGWAGAWRPGPRHRLALGIASHSQPFVRAERSGTRTCTWYEDGSDECTGSLPESEFVVEVAVLATTSLSWSYDAGPVWILAQGYAQWATSPLESRYPLGAVVSLRIPFQTPSTRGSPP